MALTGICLIGFLCVHLVGNLTLFGGAEAFNGYVETLDVVKPVIRVVEVILVAIFVFHIYNAYVLWWGNKKARPVAYKVNASSQNSSIFSRTMIYTGSIVFIFLALHLSTIWTAFNFGGHAEGSSAGYYDIIVKTFQSPIYSVIYLLAVILLGFHLNHGFQSAFQTFGWNHKKYFSFIKGIGTAYSIIVALGFASIPIYFYFFFGGN